MPFTRQVPVKWLSNGVRARLCQCSRLNENGPTGLARRTWYSRASTTVWRTRSGYRQIRVPDHIGGELHQFRWLQFSGKDEQFAQAQPEVDWWSHRAPHLLVPCVDMVLYEALMAAFVMLPIKHGDSAMSDGAAWFVDGWWTRMCSPPGRDVRWAVTTPAWWCAPRPAAPMPPQRLRHAHATHALLRDAPDHMVQGTLGHASLVTATCCAHMTAGVRQVVCWRVLPLPTALPKGRRPGLCTARSANRARMGHIERRADGLETQPETPVWAEDRRQQGMTAPCSTTTSSMSGRQPLRMFSSPDPPARRGLRCVLAHP